MATIRAAGIGGFAEVVRELGADPRPLVRAAGLDVAVLDHDEVPIAERRLAGLLEHAAVALDCPDFGLRMAGRHGLGTLGPLAVMLANCRTGADALAATQRYLNVHADSLRVDLVADPDGRDGVVALRYRGEVGGVQALDAGIGFLHRALGLLFGDEYGLLDVLLPYAGATDFHQRFYGAPVRFGADHALLRVRAELLERPVVGAREELRGPAEAYLRTLSPSDDDVTGHIRTVINDLLVFGSSSMETVARALVVHPRTLQRRLAEQGTTYAHLLDNLRRDRARHYLTETRMPFRDVSARLGFAEQATFSRACHRWWGVPPRRVRPFVGLGQVFGGP